MRIHSISDVLIVPMVILAIYLGYEIFFNSSPLHVIVLLIPVILVLMLYLFKPQLDYWWHTKFPLKIDKELSAFMSMHNPHYANLEGEEREKFEHRLALYMEAREFKAIGHEQRDAPYDIKALISSIPIQLTMHKKDFLMGDIDRIFLYKHPFPTPQKQFLHSVETHVEDGVIIMSLEAFNLAKLNPTQYYHVGWFAYLDVYFKLFKDSTERIESYANWESIALISGFDEKHILAMTGLKSIDPLVIVSTLYFTHTEMMKEKSIDMFLDFKKFFS